MPYIQSRGIRYAEVEYSRLQEWRKKKLHEQQQKEQRNADLKNAEYELNFTEEQTLANQMRSRQTIKDPGIQKNPQSEILGTLKAFMEKHEQQYMVLKKMLFQIQGQVLPLQKNVPNRPIVVKQENAENENEG